MVMSMLMSLVEPPVPFILRSAGLEMSGRMCLGSTSNWESGHSLPPGSGLQKARRLTASLATSWAWATRPSPGHLPLVVLPGEESVGLRDVVVKTEEDRPAAGADGGQSVDLGDGAAEGRRVVRIAGEWTRRRGPSR